VRERRDGLGTSQEELATGLGPQDVWQESREAEYVFGGAEEVKPLVAIRKTWVAVLQAAAVNRFRFHDLRHTFASKLVTAGVDRNTVRELLGHKSVAMTLRYAHLAPEHKAAAVEVLVARARDGEAA
jgi:integrase